jgi:general secretion pathway protein J
MRCKKISPHGFTLIELLVAISILAIVAVLGWRGLDSIVRSREILTADLELTRGLQLTFAQMQNDCSQNLNPLSYPNLPEHRSSWIEPQRLIIIRNDYVDDEAPSMQVIVYRLKDSNLMRFESNSTRDLNELRQFLEQAKNPPDNQVGIVMQKNVQSIEFAGYPEKLAAPETDDGKPDEKKQPPQPPPTPPTPPPPPPPDGAPPAPPPLPESDGSENLQKVNQNSVSTGLQVLLQLQKSESTITKIFMLGGA